MLIFKQAYWLTKYQIKNFVFKLRVKFCDRKGSVTTIIPLESGYDIPHCEQCGAGFIQTEERPDLCAHP